MSNKVSKYYVAYGYNWYAAFGGTRFGNILIHIHDPRCSKEALIEQFTQAIKERFTAFVEGKDYGSITILNYYKL